MASFYVENFGCRATQADGAALERQFRERGLERAATARQAQVVVLNTCTVTAAADQDARAAIRRIRRQNPGCQILVTGCYAQRAPEEIAALPGVTQVIGNSHKHELVNIAIPASVPDVRADDEPRTACPEPNGEGTEDERRVFVSDIFAHTELLAAPVFDATNERTRPNLKVQDGCDHRCSFCVIPFVRGQSRSLPLSQILREVQALVETGYREVVISGINLGRWGRDLDGTTRLSASDRNPGARVRRLRFEDLVRAILDETPLEKLRISSIEPMDWSDELIRLVAESPRVAKHAHVPMQSASERILRLMHRKYRPGHYREKIEKIHAAMPAAAIGADVMVGFPGETDADFKQTRAMIGALPFTYLHVFTYSARPGTPAASMRNQVPVRIARERNRVLRELAAKKRHDFMQSFVGGTVEAITLRSAMARTPASAVLGAPSPFTECLTDNYLKLYLKEHHEPNRWLRARVERFQDGGLVGNRAGV